MPEFPKVDAARASLSINHSNDNRGEWSAWDARNGSRDPLVEVAGLVWYIVVYQ